MKKTYSASEKELRDRLAVALRENRKLNVYKEEEALTKRIVLHEIKNPLNNVNGLAVNLYMNGEELPIEDKNEIYTLIRKEASKIEDIANVLYLDGCSKTELKKGAEPFSLEKMITNYAHTINTDLSKEDLTLNLKYNKPHAEEMKIYANKSLFEILWGTLTGNAVNFAPKETRIKQGVRFDEEGNLEIIMENQHKDHVQQRKFAGMGKGIGLTYIKKIINTLGGTVQMYDCPIITSTYDASQKFGSKAPKSNSENDYNTLGIKINLGLSEISK